MINIAVDPLSDHIGRHILHWIITQSGQWYSKVNANLQDNLRNIETGVAVIDNILSPKEEELHMNLQENYEEEEIEALMRNNNYNHFNILNQIINMNINFNENSSHESRQTRESRNNQRGGSECYLFKINLGFFA